MTPSGPWYRETGQSMGRVLQMAGELDAYTLTDRGTWLAYAGQSPLRVVSEGDPRLFNPYSIIAVNPKRYADINHAGAQALIDWLVSPAGQRLIGDFRIHGRRLFTPSASGK
jgi:tungstate transport system substrate-binding protein